MLSNPRYMHVQEVGKCSAALPPPPLIADVKRKSTIYSHSFTELPLLLAQ